MSLKGAHLNDKNEETRKGDHRAPYQSPKQQRRDEPDGKDKRTSRSAMIDQKKECPERRQIDKHLPPSVTNPSHGIAATFAAEQYGRCHEEWRKTLGRERGYAERHEVTGPQGGPIQHAHIHLWEERLQAVHTEMAAKKQALLLERNADGTFTDPQETA